MTERIPSGSWVEIGRVLLRPGERAPQVPAETQRVPLEMRVKGFLVSPGVHGETVEVRTLAGRRVRGVLREVNPVYSHGFGPPVPELIVIAEEVRE